VKNGCKKGAFSFHLYLRHIFHLKGCFFNCSRAFNGGALRGFFSLGFLEMKMLDKEKPLHYDLSLLTHKNNQGLSL